MYNRQLEALGTAFTALPENIDFIDEMRNKYDIFFPENKKEKKKYIKSWSSKTIMAMEADCLKYVAKLEEFAELTKILKAIDELPPEFSAVLKKELNARDQFGGIYIDYQIELAKNLANYILKDEWLPFPEKLIGEIKKMKEADGTIWYLASFGPLTDMKRLTKKMIKTHKKQYKQPIFGAKNYVRNSRYFTLFKMGYSDAAIADMELAPLVKKTKIDIYSNKYNELVKKEKDAIRQARKQFRKQLKKMVDN